ncbi:MAG TPA: DNA mismatch repair endonuclease MutL [Polyangia bacterium]
MSPPETFPQVAGRIRLLPPDLAEQIAAGEVVERPGSVVKELVENALDAGARKIEVTLEAGGRRLIRIVDDGCGMTPDEARLALLRHATSKITRAEDLWSLRTFGFRGEALPSIASVSRFVLATKVPASLSGFRLSLEGGREVEAREHGMPDGTQIEVRDLFFNVPARLKFLKTEATEAGNVTDTLLRLSLANPAVHVRLRSNDRLILDLPPVDSFAERVRTALGRRGTGALHETMGEENGVKVHAFVAAPDEASTTPRNTFLFVAKRAVRDRALVSALAMGYGDLLERGRYPLAALFIELEGPDLDVNVHPQKLEVRFANAQEVYAAVRHVVAAGITSAPWLSSHASFSLPMKSNARSMLEPDDAGPPGFPPGASDVPPWSIESVARHAARGLNDRAEREPTPQPRPAPELELPARSTGFVEQLSYVAPLHGRYLACEAPGELVLIDHHAARERLALAGLREAATNQTGAMHALLFPVEIEVDERTATRANTAEVQAGLARLGFEVDGFSGRRLVVRAVPIPLKNAPAKPILLDAIAGLADWGSPRPSDELLLRLAMHAGDSAGATPSDRTEAIALLAALADADLRGRCGHGRAVSLRLPLSELERRLGRG